MGEGGTNIRGRFPNVIPVTSLWHLKTMNLFKMTWIGVAVKLSRLCRFLIPNVTNSLEEKQRKYVALPVGTVDGRPTKSVCGFPKD